MRRLAALFVLVPVVVVLVLTSGCASAYQKNYVGVASCPAAPSPAGPVEVRGGADLRSDDARLAADGWVLLGYSGFSGTKVSEEGARDQARRVGASLVLLYVRPEGFVPGVGGSAFTMPNPDRVIKRLEQGNTPSGQVAETEVVSGGVTMVLDTNGPEPWMTHVATFWARLP